MRRRALTEAGAALGAGILAALPALAVLASGHTLVWRDTAQLYEPHRVNIVAALRALRVPVWNPWEATGQPLLAQGLHSVLHPVSVALAFITSSTDALIVVLVVLAAAGAWAAARALRGGRAAAATAAFAFATSGFVLAMSANVLYLFGAATGPWAVAGLVAAARWRAGWLAAAAGIAALALSGDAGALAAFGLVGLALAVEEGGVGGGARAAAGAALGVALAAVQLLPSWRYLAETARGAGLLDAVSLVRWPLHPWRLPELVLPGLFVGVPTSYIAPVYEALAGSPADRFPFTCSVFVGAPVLVLAAEGARRSRWARWLLALSILFLWLALGRHAGSQALLARVPVWGTLRYWEKMVGPLTLCLALAAAAGVDAWASASPPRLARPLALGAALVLAAAGVSALAWAISAPGGAAELLRLRLLVGLAQAGVGLCVLGAAMWVGRRRPALAGAALAAAVLAQAAAASPFALHAGDPGIASVRPPAIVAAAPGPRVVAPLGFDPERGGGGLDAIDLLQRWENRTGRPSSNVRVPVDSLVAYTGLSSLRWEMVLASGPLFWELARRYALTHVLSRPPVTADEAAALEGATVSAVGPPAAVEPGLAVWEVAHRDWATFAPGVRTAPSLELAGAMLGEELVAGRATVVVEAATPLAASPGRVLAARRGETELAVEAESLGDGVLVVNDAWAPGWSATIDGAAVDVLPADVLVRAVRWPAGRHRLVMRYEAPGLVAGGWVSALALAVAVAALGVQRARRPAEGGVAARRSRGALRHREMPALRDEPP
ncbi:MAG TPA: hypothetical protein VM753_02090 [Anaeromyxobacter sp.]|nr:hypothetical protein [Anaeromyxobacter sp.]